MELRVVSKGIALSFISYIMMSCHKTAIEVRDRSSCVDNKSSQDCCGKILS